MMLTTYSWKTAFYYDLGRDIWRFRNQFRRSKIPLRYSAKREVKVREQWQLQGLEFMAFMPHLISALLIRKGAN
jgi:hypothetical protein